MDWFYVQMVEMHALTGWLSAAIFAVRGAAALFDAPWRMDFRLLAIAFLVYVGLIVSGLSLWVLMHHNPLYDGWLAGKLVALVVFAVCAHWAVGDGRYRAVGYVLGLLAVGYTLAAAMTRQALPGM